MWIRLWGDYREPSQLFLGMTGKSGTRKTSALRKFMRPLEQWLMSMRFPGQEALPGPKYETICTDATPEALLVRMAEQGGRGIFYTDEGDFLNILGGSTYGNGKSLPNIGGVMKGYDGDPVSVVRKGQGGSIDITEAHLAMTIGLQPQVLENFASNPNLCDRGLPQRLLFFIPEPVGRIDVNTLTEAPEDTMQHWAKKITYLASLHREQPLEMTCSQQVAQTIRDFWQYMVDAQETTFCENDALYAWASKAHGKAARLAGLLTLLDNPDAREVSLHAAEAAVALMKEYFNPHAVRAFCGVRKLSQPASALLKVIQSSILAGASYIKCADLKDKARKQKQFKGPEAGEVFSKAIEELIAACYIRPYYLPVNQYGRPNDGAYALNPAYVKGMKRPAGSPPLPGSTEEAPEIQPVTQQATVDTPPPYQMPNYNFKPKTLEELQWEKEAEEDNGLPF